MPPSLSVRSGSRAFSKMKRWTSARPKPSPWTVVACSGPKTIRSWLCEKYQPTLEPSETDVSAIVWRMPAAVVDTWSLTLWGASPPKTVTASPAWSGPQGLAASFSASA